MGRHLRRLRRPLRRELAGRHRGPDELSPGGGPVPRTSRRPTVALVTGAREVEAARWRFLRGGASAVGDGAVRAVVLASWERSRAHAVDTERLEASFVGHGGTPATPLEARRRRARRGARRQPGVRRVAAARRRRRPRPRPARRRPRALGPARRRAPRARLPPRRGGGGHDGGDPRAARGDGAGRRGSRALPPAAQLPGRRGRARRAGPAGPRRWSSSATPPTAPPTTCRGHGRSRGASTTRAPAGGGPGCSRCTTPSTRRARTARRGRWPPTATSCSSAAASGAWRPRTSSPSATARSPRW